MSEIPQTTLTPMLQQYLQLKSQQPDAILFFRLGDFYEMFFEDARTAAPVLEVQLTSRDRNSTNPVPMCGVPYHAAANYIQKLVHKGFKVAVCEQFEDPVPGKPGKTSIRREITRVVTPALIADPEWVAEDSQNILLSLSGEENQIGIAAVDLLASEIRTGEVTADRLQDLILRLQPKEFLLSLSEKESDWIQALQGTFPNHLFTFRDSFLGEKPLERAVTAAKKYLEETQKLSSTQSVSRKGKLSLDGYLSLDATTLASLEILKSQSQAVDGPSLYSVLDKTLTPMGRRTLKDWLAKPLSERGAIEGRLDAVDFLFSDTATQENLSKCLSGIRDLERLATKVALGLAMPRDLVAVREIQKALPEIQALLQQTPSPLLKAYASHFALLSDLTTELEAALEDEAPATLREGQIIKETYHGEVGELRSLCRDAKGSILQMETREREATGISSLKIKYNKVFGYTIEVTTTHLKKVPDHYIRKQTIANGERFLTPELKQFEEKVITAESRLRALEESLFLSLRQKVAEQVASLHKNASLLGEIDCLLGFAKVSRARGYKRPEIHSGWDLRIQGGRHPVVETRLKPGEFVANAVDFLDEECRSLVITGPNMAGKSTIMRQVALIVLMAHAGCFVPAESASIPLVDSIFTRIGSSDDLARGQSTFMVEMSEVSRILQHATDRSLILIDEIGRGTSTYDGLSLAWSLMEYLHTEIKAKVLFATHFHEITILEKTLPRLRNANVLVEKWENEIVFLHRLAPGICNRSYGIEVARLAGLPSKVLSRARKILGVLESQSQRGNRNRGDALQTEDNQLAFFRASENLETRASIDS